MQTTMALSTANLHRHDKARRSACFSEYPEQNKTLRYGTALAVAGTAARAANETVKTYEIRVICLPGQSADTLAALVRRSRWRPDL